jgi:hypothetical protein
VLIEHNFIKAKIGPQFSLCRFFANAIGCSRSLQSLPALANSDQESHQSASTEGKLSGREHHNPKRPSGGVFLGGEIALFLLGFPGGLWIGYEALRKGGNASVISDILLCGLVAAFSSLVSGYCLLMLLLALSAA